MDERSRLLKARGVVASDPVLYVSPPMPLSGDSKWLASEVLRGRFELAVDEVEVDGRWRATTGLARVTLHEPGDELRYGDRVVVTGTARAPRRPTGPGQADRATALRRRGVAAVMAVESDVLVLESRGGGGLFQWLACAVRGKLRRVVRTTLSRRDPRAGAMVCATVLGDRAELDDALEEAFRRSGTMHLLAISGLHVGIVALLVWKATSLLGLGRRLAGGLVLATVLLYAVMIGWTPAVARAAVFTAALVAAIVGRRRGDTLQATALAALVLLLLRPYDLFNAGFQLSFAAVVSIGALYHEFWAAFRRPETLERRLLDEAEMGPLARALRWPLRRLKRLLWGCFLTSAVAWLGVFPLIAYYFNLFSPVTVLANIVAVPLLMVVVVLGFTHLAFGVVWSVLAWPSGWLAQWATAGLAAVVRGAARLPLAWTHCAAPPLGWLVAYYALGAVVLARRRLGLSRRRAAMLWLAGVAVYLYASLAPARPSGLEVTALAVEHGLAVVLRYPDGSTVVYDSGTYGRLDVGRYVTAPALWARGVRRIDLLVLSHADVDHINGVPSLLERFPVGRVLHTPVLGTSDVGAQLLGMLDARGIPHQPAVAGDRFAVGGANVLEALAPVDWLLRTRPKNQNENGLVLRAGHAGRRVLLTGDIQQLAATILLSAGVDLRADVLLVPHHGCNMPNARAFAAAVRPAVAICSNRADHLHPDTLAAYRDAGADLYATCWDGTITVRLDRRGIHVQPFRQRRAE